MGIVGIVKGKERRRKKNQARSATITDEKTGVERVNGGED